MEQKTLRDEFAMAALTGMVAYSGLETSYGNFTDFASISFKYADAMMEEREKQNKE
jgi:hypothetical protein